jgi:hypothetical protein
MASAKADSSAEIGVGVVIEHYNSATIFGATAEGFLDKAHWLVTRMLSNQGI